jgi:hypothetical protein
MFLRNDEKFYKILVNLIQSVFASPQPLSNRVPP